MSEMNVILTPNNINLKEAVISESITTEGIRNLEKNIFSHNSEKNLSINVKPALKQGVYLEKTNFSLNQAKIACDEFSHINNNVQKQGVYISVSNFISVYINEARVQIPLKSHTINKEDLAPYKRILDKATKIVIPDGVTEIGPETFTNYKNLQEVSLPNTVTKISWWAFGNCENLTTINIPNNVTQIGEWAFHNCKGIKELVLPPNCEMVGSKAFKGCLNLKRIFCSEKTFFDEKATLGCHDLEIYVYHKK